MEAVQAAVSGALQGSLFALMALGLSLTWGFLRVINLAHFGVILLGAYLTIELAGPTGLGPLGSLVVTVPALFVVGAVVHLLFDRFRVSELNSLLISYGFLIVIIQVVQNVWTADFQRLPGDVNPYATQSVRVGDLIFPLPTVMAALFATVLVMAMKFFLDRTYAGRALQAFGQDREIASAFGIDHRTLGLLLAGASGATAAMAGMLFTLRGTVTPDSALEWVGLVFAIVILGGIGNVSGTLWAGLLVGAVSGLVAIIWSPATSPLVVFTLVVLALLFRPQGLFRRKAAH
ncbi:MAG TPA: branched-chain amino acid ABC transporter permease [Acidimicrobiia bacterium]